MILNSVRFAAADSLNHKTRSADRSGENLLLYIFKFSRPNSWQYYFKIFVMSFVTDIYRNLLSVLSNLLLSILSLRIKFGFDFRNILVK